MTREKISRVEATHGKMLGTGVFRVQTRARACANEFAEPVPAQVRAAANDSAAISERVPQLFAQQSGDASRVRVPCGGRRRRDGKPCEAQSVPGKRRCRWHGGMSTGPRTAEGKRTVTGNLPWVRKKEARR
jgi:hypothetical protein